MVTGSVRGALAVYNRDQSACHKEPEEGMLILVAPPEVARCERPRREDRVPVLPHDMAADGRRDKVPEARVGQRDFR